MEGCIPDAQRIIRTHCDVLWTLQFAWNLLTNDGGNSTPADTETDLHCVHGRHCGAGDHKGGAEKEYVRDIGNSKGEPTVPQGIEVSLGSGGVPSLGICGRKRTVTNGGRQSGSNKGLENT